VWLLLMPESPMKSAVRITPERWILLALLIATLLKVAWAATSAGSVDAVLFFNYARMIDHSGLCHIYSVDPRFNHTPLTATLVHGLFLAAGGVFTTFAFLLRLIGIVADFAVVLALLRLRPVFPALPTWALVLFAASPISLIVTGFHGNVDPVMTALMFFAAVACLRERAVWCGLLFGLACNIKIVPMLFAPVFFFFWMSLGGMWRFVVPAGAVMIAGFVYPLLHVPEPYLKHVFGYGSVWGVWGLSYWLRQTGWSAVQTLGFSDLSRVQSLIATGLKVMIVLGISVLAWRRRHLPPPALFATLAGAWAVFFIFVPGVGTQYMVWLAPFILLLNGRWYLAVTAAASVFLAVFYHLSSPARFPWFLAIPQESGVAPSALAGNLPWLVMIALLVTHWRGLFNPAVPASQADQDTRAQLAPPTVPSAATA